MEVYFLCVFYLMCLGIDSVKLYISANVKQDIAAHCLATTSPSFSQETSRREILCIAFRRVFEGIYIELAGHYFV